MSAELWWSTVHPIDLHTDKPGTGWGRPWLATHTPTSSSHEIQRVEENGRLLHTLVSPWHNQDVTRAIIQAGDLQSPPIHHQNPPFGWRLPVSYFYFFFFCLPEYNWNRYFLLFVEKPANSSTCPEMARPGFHPQPEISVPLLPFPLEYLHRFPESQWQKEMFCTSTSLIVSGLLSILVFLHAGSSSNREGEEESTLLLRCSQSWQVWTFYYSLHSSVVNFSRQNSDFLWCVYKSARITLPSTLLLCCSCH